MTEHVLETNTFRLSLSLRVFETDNALDPYALMTVRVESGGYCGDAELDVDLREFAAFARDLRKLYDTLSGEATVREPFGYKRFLSFSAEPRGHIRVKGYLCDAMNDHELRFENEFDQSYLRAFSQELVSACSRYQRPE